MEGAGAEAKELVAVETDKVVDDTVVAGTVK